jgi:hypothetical protein
MPGAPAPEFEAGARRGLREKEQAAADTIWRRAGIRVLLLQDAAVS